ncbi:MAG: SpoIIE family protein phosphatase [Thermoleophilaceae bacterium]|nr:SpoIIE family protein phosphatase [Thermoleophilaceae bacterium]
MDSQSTRWSLPGAQGTFVLALGVVSALAVVDLLVADAVLVELLVAGPLLAAVNTDARRTQIVALYALVLSVPLGLASDEFGSLQHLVGVLSVAIGGGLAVALSRLRSRERSARESATRARDELDAMLGGIADAVTGQAPDGSIIYANDAALETLGFETREELESTSPAEILARFDLYTETGEPYPLDRLPGRRSLSGAGDAEDIVRFRVRATGEERWSVVKSTPVHDADGFLRMAINVIEDITAHKRAELAERFMSESSRLLASSLDPDEVLEQVANLAVPEVADWCAVDILRIDGEVERVALAHADPEMLEKGVELSRRYPPRSDQNFGAQHVIRTGRSEFVAEIPQSLIEALTEDEHHLELVNELGMRSGMTVPMTARSGTLGAMTFVTGPSGRRFDERDLELAEELARRCATAVENARLYGERAYIARTLQESLLPAELPDIPGIESAARFRPTGEGQEMGGDFYDLFSSGGRGWTVVMGDVCGKGPDAAAVTALARYTLRAAAMRERLPSRGLHVLNEALLRQRTDRRFCTVAYAYLESIDSGVRLGFASGGHPLPLLLRPDGSVEAVGAPGTLLGVVPDPTFEDRSIELAPGDALVFYTDGVIEDRGDGGLEEDSLATVLAGCAGMGADAIAACVEDAAISSRNGHPRDDIAVLVLRVADR